MLIPKLFPSRPVARGFWPIGKRIFPIDQGANSNLSFLQARWRRESVMNIPSTLAIIIASSCCMHAFGQATSSKFTAEALQKVEIGMPRETVESYLGLPLRERIVKASKEDACPFDLVYCRYTIWQKEEPEEFRRSREAAGEAADDPDDVNSGDGYAVVEVQVYYDKKTNAVALLVVDTLASVMKYSFPGGILGITSFAQLKSSAAQEDFVEGYKTSQWWAELHNLKKERYYWLLGSPEYTTSYEEAYKSENRAELLDRKRTIVGTMLLMGNKGAECNDQFKADRATTPGWVSDRDED